MYGVSGGANQYLIEISYKVIPQLTSDIGTIVVLISENMIGLQTYTFRVSSDVTSIKIKNAEKFPYITVNMNGLVIDKS